MPKCGKCGHGSERCKCPRRSLSSDGQTSDHSRKSRDSHNSKTSEKSHKSSTSHTSKKSHKSDNSTGSKDSQRTATSGVSELTVLTKTMSQDLNLAAEGLQTLVNNEVINKAENYINSVGVAGWTREMRAAHATYHKCGDQRNQSRKQFDNWYKDKCLQDPTIENYNELRRLAVKWADIALKEMEGRLEFMISYPRAFEDGKAYNNHLKRIQDVANSAKKAIEKIRKTRETVVSMRGSSSAA
ncbi:hypothetical protein EAE96_007848 [Botrytis aclada]|nr:hypothetical protein EAE96_007848 [Botrytis aclada]